MSKNPPHVEDPLKRFPYVRCFSCNQMGHYAANCTNSSVSSGQKPKEERGEVGTGPEALAGVVGGGMKIEKGPEGPPPGPNLAHPTKAHPRGGSVPPLPPHSTRGARGAQRGGAPPRQ